MSLLVVTWGGYAPVFRVLAVVIGLSSFGVIRVRSAETNRLPAHSTA
jgi:hypothetical protein